MVLIRWARLEKSLNTMRGPSQRGMRKAAIPVGQADFSVVIDLHIALFRKSGVKTLDKVTANDVNSSWIVRVTIHPNQLA